VSSVVDVRVPAHGLRPVEEIVASIVSAERLRPFDPILIDFVAEFALRLSRAARGYAELQALAFWMRRAEVTRLGADFASLATGRTRLMPRGIVLHVPPANVDTIFIYSWLLSLLTGNRCIVRLSSRSTDQTDLIVGVIVDILREERFSAVASSTAMVRYGHDETITSALSAACDLRVIWGGDATVATIRRSPLPPHASDLTFPDRVSLAVFDAEQVAMLDEVELAALAERFYNDAYWFNQLGCSSPRSVIWVGAERVARTAADRFFPALHSVTKRKGLIVEPGTAIAKLTDGYGLAITGEAIRVQAIGSQVLVIDDRHLGPLPVTFPGAGTFHTARVDDLVDLLPFITRRHQTLSHFGFDATRLSLLADVLLGAGIDRFVPVGDALTFNRYWDGYDLLQSFTRRVYIDSGRDDA